MLHAKKMGKWGQIRRIKVFGEGRKEIWKYLSHIRYCHKKKKPDFMRPTRLVVSPLTLDSRLHAGYANLLGKNPPPQPFNTVINSTECYRYANIHITTVKKNNFSMVLTHHCRHRLTAPVVNLSLLANQRPGRPRKAWFSTSSLLSSLGGVAVGGASTKVRNRDIHSKQALADLTLW